MKVVGALSIKQPLVEQIFRGTKRFEYKSRPTTVRGRVYVYASLRPRPRGEWRGLPFQPEDVPHGLVVGTVKIVGRRRLGASDYAWRLKSQDGCGSWSNRGPAPNRSGSSPFGR